MFDKNDIIGKRFGRLIVFEYSHARKLPCGKYKHYYKCRCDCGNECICDRGHLKTGHTQSCGCRQKESVIKKNIETATRQGDVVKYKRLYNCWTGMLNRCENKKDVAYHRYGGRGIKICDEWHNWVAFKEWALNNGYSDDLTIDRINVNGNYEPQNCRWADRIAQANNTRANRYIEYKGKVQSLASWCRELHKEKFYDLIRGRLNRGWSIEKAFNEPVK